MELGERGDLACFMPKNNWLSWEKSMKMVFWEIYEHFMPKE